MEGLAKLLAYEIDQGAATLITGVLAVGAAIYVGVRQTGIQKRLASIEATKVRLELLERRSHFISVFLVFNTNVIFLKLLPDFQSSLEKSIRVLEKHTSDNAFLFGKEHDHFFSEVNAAISAYFKGKVESEIYKRPSDYEEVFLSRIERLKPYVDVTLRDETRLFRDDLLEQVKWKDILFRIMSLLKNVT